MRGKSLLALLEGGDRRSIGHAGLWSGDDVVRMRAGDAAEKVAIPRLTLDATERKLLLRLEDR
jgi:hypothetical protein